MNRNTQFLRIAHPWLLLFLLQGMFTLIPKIAVAQLRLAVMVAPAVQNLTIAEATITDGYKARLLPHAGILASYGIAKGFTVRLGMRYEANGFKYRLYPQLDHPYERYWQMIRIDFVKATLGGGYSVKVADQLTFGGAVDIVFGLPFAGNGKAVEDGRRVQKNKLLTSFYNNYWGLDMGLTIQYQLPNGIGIALSPTFQTQINKVLNNGSLIYKFVGFAPRVELSFPLSRVK